MIKFIKIKKVEDKLTREDLPTDKELQKILAVCADSSMFDNKLKIWALLETIFQKFQKTKKCHVH